MEHDQETAVEHEWTELKEMPPHSGQQYRVEHLPPASQTACAPQPGAGRGLTSFVADFASGLFHNGSWEVRGRYRYTVGGGGGQYGEVSLTVNFGNLLLQPEGTNPVVLAWDPDDPSQRQTGVRLAVGDAQIWTALVQLKVYRLDDPARERAPLRMVNVGTAVPADWVEIEWDGRDEMGNVMERGLYAYDLVATQEGGALDIDYDRKTSDSLFIDAELDENGNPILEAQLAGRDEGDPDDPADDAFLIIVRYYRLRDTGGKDAYGGKVILYNPSLQPVKEWDLAGLPCASHEAPDGLKATAEGLQHAVRLHVPVGLIPELENADNMTDEELRNLDYRFVLSVTDDHADDEKGHRRKPALERNAKGFEPPKIRLVGIQLLALGDAGEKHFPLYTRHLPKPIRDGLKSQLCPDDSNREHAHLKPYYPTVTGIAIPPATGYDAPQWKRHLYSNGRITWCKYPERAAVPMGQKLVVKADIDSNLSGTYSVKVKLTCMEMKGYGSGTASLSFTNTVTGNGFSPEIPVSNWDAEDYGSLRWESSPFPQQANRWVIKLRWQIYYRPSAGGAWSFDDVTSTHVIYETLGEPLDCGTEDYKKPWYVILDRATEWAAGKPSWADATEAITKKVYDMPLFDYPRYDPSAVPPINEWPLLRSFASVGVHAIELDADEGTTSTDPSGTNGLYPLLPHSADLGGKYAPTADAKAQCTDAASILVVLFRAMGVNATTLLIDDPGGPDWFGTKDIDPIGAPGWRSIPNWNYHHLGDLNTASPAGPLYDACLTLDAGGHTRRYVVGMDWSTYQSMLWDGSGTFNIHGRYIPGIVQPYYHGQHRQGSETF